MHSLPFKAQPLAKEVPSVLTGVVGFGCSLAAAFDMEMQYKAPPQKDTVGGYKAPPPEVADSGVDGSELIVSEPDFHFLRVHPKVDVRRVASYRFCSTRCVAQSLPPLVTPVTLRDFPHSSSRLQSGIDCF